MRRLVGLAAVLLSAAILFSSSTKAQTKVNPNQISSGNIASSITFTGSNTMGKLNAVCYVDGVQNTTLQAAVTCAGTSGRVVVPSAAGALTLSSNVAIPSGVALEMQIGASIAPNPGVSLTVNGAIIAPELCLCFLPSQAASFVFTHPGGPVYANWFAGGDLGIRINRAYAAISTAPAQGGTIYVAPGAIETVTTNVTYGSSSAPTELRIGRGSVITFNTTGGSPAISVGDHSGLRCEGEFGDNGIKLQIGTSAVLSALLTNTGTGGTQEYFWTRGCQFTSVASAAVPSQAVVWVNQTGIGTAIENTLIYNNTAALGLLIQSQQVAQLNDVWFNQNGNNFSVVDSFGIIGNGIYSENCQAASCYHIQFKRVSDAGSVAKGSILQNVHIEYSPAASDTKDAILIDGYDGLVVDNYTTSTLGGNTITNAIRVINSSAGTNRLGYSIRNWRHLAGALTNFLSDTVTGGTTRTMSTVNFGTKIEQFNNTGVTTAGEGLYVAGAATPVELGIWNMAGTSSPYVIQADSGALLHFNIRGNSDVMRFNGANFVSFPGFGMGVTNLTWSSTAPTIAAAGCGGGAASISVQNGTAAFKINVGTTPGSACTITMPTATTGWNCSATDITTNSTSVFLQKQTGAESTTSVTITNFNDVAVATAFVASDILKVACSAD